jgi:hypothetical protein
MVEVELLARLTGKIKGIEHANHYFYTDLCNTFAGLMCVILICAYLG